MRSFTHCVPSNWNKNLWEHFNLIIFGKLNTTQKWIVGYFYTKRVPYGLKVAWPFHTHSTTRKSAKNILVWQNVHFILASRRHVIESLVHSIASQFITSSWSGCTQKNLGNSKKKYAFLRTKCGILSHMRFISRIAIENGPFRILDWIKDRQKAKTPTRLAQSPFVVVWL